MTIKKRRWLLALTMGLALLPLQKTLAQDAQETKAKSDYGLEEVIVSAERREMNLQDVAASIQAVDRDLLQNNEINNVQDLTKLVPSLVYEESFDPATSDMRMRGIGQDSGSALNVGLMVDEVPISGAQGALEFADLERVEIMRGPQGTMFGINASAGVIHFITRDASQEFEAYSRFTVEDNATWPGGMHKTQLGINGGLTDKLAGRLSGYYTEADGHLVDLEQNDNPPDNKAYGLRARFRWEPTDSLVVKPILEYTDRDGQAHTFVYSSSNPQKAEREREKGIVAHDENRTARSAGDWLITRTKMFTLGVDWALGWANFASVTGVNDFTIKRLNSAMYQTGDRQHALSFIFVDSKTLTQEFRLASPQPFEIVAPFGLFKIPGNFDYTTGIFWSHGESDSLVNIEVRDIPAGQAAEVLFGLPLTIVNLAPADSIGADIKTDTTGESTNLGVFGHLTWHLTDRLRMNSGLRYIEDEREGEGTVDFFLFHEATGVETSALAPDDTKASLSDTDVIGNVALQYDWSDHSVTYFRVATGYRGGQTQPENSEAPEVGPEHTRNIEMGIKSKLFSNRLHVNLAVFYQTVDDYQVSFSRASAPQEGVPVGISLESVTENAGQLLTRGVELDFMMQPLESFSLTGSIMYNETRYNKFIASQCFAGQRDGERGGEDLDGDGTCDTQNLEGYPLRNAPFWGASLVGRYSSQLELLGGSRAYVQVTGRYKSEVNMTSELHPLAWVDSHQIWDLRFGWQGLDDRLEVAPYVTNLFKQFYPTAMYQNDIFGSRLDMAHFVPAAADRQYGMTVAYHF